MAEGDLEFSYPSTDMLIRFPLKDRVIESLSQSDLDISTRATILFSDGQALVLDYEYATERTTVRLESVA